jgi:hypothetical protein
MRNHRLRAAASKKGPLYKVELGGTSNQYFFNIDIQKYTISETIAGMPSGISYPEPVGGGFYTFFFQELSFTGNSAYVVNFKRDSNNIQLSLHSFYYTGGTYNTILQISAVGADNIVRVEIHKGNSTNDPIVFTGYISRTYHPGSAFICENKYFYRDPSAIYRYFFGQLFNETCCFNDLTPTICDDPDCPPEEPDYVQYQECCTPYSNGILGNESCGSVIADGCQDFSFWCG